MWSRNASQPEPSSQLRGRCGRIVGIERPGDQNGGEPARGERGRRSPHDVLRDGIAAHAAVPEQVGAFGRDDIRRVGDDEIELLALDRVEEAACRVSTLLDAVEGRVELRVGERPRVHVGRDDALGVGGEQDRLDPVTGAKVERTLALAANGQVRERDRRAVHARHVVGVPFRRGA